MVTRLLAQAVIVHDPDIGEDTLGDLKHALAKLGTHPECRAREPGRYNAWEWMLPATVILFLAKRVLDGFLQELGAGGARSLKTALAGVFRRAKDRNHRWATQDDLEEITKNKRRTRSMTSAQLGKPRVPLAIEIVTEGRGFVRLAFPFDLDTPLFVEALRQFPEAVIRAETTREQHAVLRERWHTLLATSPADAFESLVKQPEGLDTEITYVFQDPTVGWFDAKSRHRRDVQKQIARRAKDRKR